MGAIGATLGSATNNLYSSPKKVSTLYTTWLFYLNWIWRRKFEICKVLALGALPLGPHRSHMYHMNNFESLAPKDDSCHVWLKSNHAFSNRRWNSYILQRAHRGLLGATLGTAMNNFYSSPNKVSTHYITWPFSFWIWRRRCLKFAWFWPFESPTPKDDSCQVWLKSNHAFSRRRWKCKKFTDDGRRTTHDARRTKTNGNSSLEPSAQVS